MTLIKDDSFHKVMIRTAYFDQFDPMWYTKYGLVMHLHPLTTSHIDSFSFVLASTSAVVCSDTNLIRSEERRVGKEC